MNAALTAIQIRTRSRAVLSKLEQLQRAYVAGPTRGPQRPAPFELLFEIRDGVIYIRPRGVQ
jgi:hypothetical protein